ncbi:glycerol-3-phosphate dehydrogenase [Sphingomonas abietis]|uniref:Glycerol-3-phosphate dehydrogenase n=1 Tax=Sphingomonas abietis TaxID=3012344 RepID=A0ABY7NKB8_9SPHN|nr:glycerol-3-phosphate dehydrogenase [Sphingomonas abietis]WBO21934.1 glycerol-3-phosphate dehydrogenase [Sphingomonas abietis]
MTQMSEIDLLIIGGGVNGCGIARDAAGRGLSVLLVERDDLAAHTSSASTKLIHGGLRYLEYYEFRLVREALAEREVILGIAPHLVKPLRFVMPLVEDMRPAWMIRTGLFLYDHIGGKTSLPKSEGVKLEGTPWGAGLKDIARGFVYSDAWVDDARLVALNAIAAAEKGATIRTRVGFTGAKRDGDRWIATLDDGTEVSARAIVNTAGPWVSRVLGELAGAHAELPPRLVKGSHIIVPRMYEGDHAYILQNDDKRIIFTIPYERDFTVIGTTDKPFEGDPSAPKIDQDEIDYLCASVNRYFTKPISEKDIVRSYSGVRPLFDDGAESASAVTRDYVLKLGTSEGPQVLSAFGGKITTYRRLSEHALEKLEPFLPKMGKGWTGDVPLPGGDLPGGDFEAFLLMVRDRWPFLSPDNAERMARAYGTRIAMVLGDATELEDLGGGLSTLEIDYLVEHEWARTAEDILWRRSKIGIHTGEETLARIEAHLAQR